MRGSMMRRTGAGLVALLVLAGCGGGDDGGSEDTGSSTDDTEAPEETLTSAGEELDELFQDDLEDDENGWGEGEDEISATEFTDDGYEVAYEADEGAYWAYADGGPVDVEDSSTTVEVAEGAGEADRWFGTTCRLSRTGPVAYYTLLVNGATGGWAIARWTSDDDEPEILEDGEDDAVEGAGEDDSVEVTGTCLGEGDGEEVELAVAVDGTEVGTATDEDGLGAGFSGVAVAPLDGDDGGEPVTFTDIEIRGDEGDGDLELEDDFSDEDSGLVPFEEAGNTVGYDDGVFAFDLTGAAFVPVPIRTPFPEEGTASAQIEGDLSNGFAGFCLAGEDGEYEFAISVDGYASLGFYPAGSDEFVLLDEATEAYESTGSHRVTAGWSTNGETTNLDIRVDDEVVTSVGNDDSLASFTQLSLCGTVASEDEAAAMSYTYDDLVVAGEG
jgi:hypothetical protein